MKQRNLTGKNTILYDDAEQESVMVRIPKFLLSDVIDGAPEVAHPAFVVGNREVECIYVSKYQNVVRDKRAYSLPGEDPAVLYSIEEAERFCRNKGAGWHLMTSAEWAAVSLWSQKNGTPPRGNNDGGKDWSMPHEHGAVVSLSAVVPEGEEGPPMRVATGSGPASWAHDGTSEGIFDMNGNVWEMTSGLRLNHGIVECVPDNDAARYTLADAPWRQICAKDLQFQNAGGQSLCMYQGEADVYFAAAECCKDKPEELFSPFSRITAQIDELKPGNLLQQLCMIPVKPEEEISAAGWGVTDDIRYPIRGGYWVNREMAGIQAYGFYMRNKDRYFDVGFRCCYIEESDEAE